MSAPDYRCRLHCSPQHCAPGPRQSLCSSDKCMHARGNVVAVRKAHKARGLPGIFSNAPLSAETRAEGQNPGHLTSVTSRPSFWCSRVDIWLGIPSAASCWARPSGQAVACDVMAACTLALRRCSVGPGEQCFERGRAGVQEVVEFLLRVWVDAAGFEAIVQHTVGFRSGADD